MVVIILMHLLACLIYFMLDVTNSILLVMQDPFDLRPLHDDSFAQTNIDVTLMRSVIMCETPPTELGFISFWSWRLGIVTMYSFLKKLSLGSKQLGSSVCPVLFLLDP